MAKLELELEPCPRCRSEAQIAQCGMIFVVACPKCHFATNAERWNCTARLVRDGKRWRKFRRFAGEDPYKAYGTTERRERATHHRRTASRSRRS